MAFMIIEAHISSTITGRPYHELIQEAYKQNFKEDYIQAPRNSHDILSQFGVILSQTQETAEETPKSTQPPIQETPKTAPSTKPKTTINQNGNKPPQKTAKTTPKKSSPKQNNNNKNKRKTTPPKQDKKNDKKQKTVIETSESEAEHMDLSEYTEDETSESYESEPEIITENYRSSCGIYTTKSHYKKMQENHETTIPIGDPRVIITPDGYNFLSVHCKHQGKELTHVDLTNICAVHDNEFLTLRQENPAQT